jgi:hypothetical protein
MAVAAVAAPAHPPVTHRRVEPFAPRRLYPRLYRPYVGDVAAASEQPWGEEVGPLEEVARQHLRGAGEGKNVWNIYREKKKKSLLSTTVMLGVLISNNDGNPSVEVAARRERWGPRGPN